jgi:hypothetical protein
VHVRERAPVVSPPPLSSGVPSDAREHTRQPEVGEEVEDLDLVVASFVGSGIRGSADRGGRRRPRSRG